MKKLFFLALLGTALMATDSHALTCQGTAWARPGGSNLPAGGANYCTTTITSATTSTQLGSLGIDTSKQITGIFTGSTALANVVTPTVTFYVGSKAIATQTVSVTTVANGGNIVQFGFLGVPYFTGLSVSQSQPSLISSTNSLSLTIFEGVRALKTQ